MFNADQAAAQIIAITQSACEIITAENQALEALDTHNFAALQDEKMKRMQDYQQALMIMHQHKEDLKSMAPMLKKEIQDQQAQFMLITRKNLEALQRMKKVSQRFKDTLHRAAQQAHRKKSAARYTADGQVDERSKKNLSMGISDTA